MVAHKSKYLSKILLFFSYLLFLDFYFMSAAWPSGTERRLLRKQYCDPCSITAAGRLLRRIRE